MSKHKALVPEFDAAASSAVSLELNASDTAKKPGPKPKLEHHWLAKSQNAKNQHRMPQAKLKTRIRRRP